MTALGSTCWDMSVNEQMSVNMMVTCGDRGKVGGSPQVKSASSGSSSSLCLSLPRPHLLMACGQAAEVRTVGQQLFPPGPQPITHELDDVAWENELQEGI